MRYNGNLLAGMLVGALGAGTYLVGGCSEDSNTTVKTATANSGGAAGATSVGGAGGATSVGGNGAGAGGSGGSVAGNYPPYFETENLPPSSPETMKIVDCLVKYDAKIKTGTEETRVGLYVVGTEWCGFCAVERKEWGLEAMQKLFDKGMYVDCELDNKSMDTCWTLGVWYVPSNNKVFEDLLNDGTPKKREGLVQYKVEGVTSPVAFANMFAPECLPTGASEPEPSQYKSYVESLKRGNPLGYKTVSGEEKESLEQQLGLEFKGNVYQK